VKKNVALRCAALLCSGVVVVCTKTQELLSSQVWRASRRFGRRNSLGESSVPRSLIQPFAIDLDQIDVVIDQSDRGEQRQIVMRRHDVTPGG